MFDDPKQAVAAALEMIQAMPTEQSSAGQPMTFSIGVDYGEIILLDQTDSFGDAVNLAHKLGEDTAGPGELLVTQVVRDAFGEDSRFEFREIPVSTSGLKMAAFVVSYS